MIDWLNNNLIKHSVVNENLVEISGMGSFLLISEKERILDDEMNLILSKEEEGCDVDFYAFKWGENYYYSESKKIKQFTPLKYIGKFDDKLQLGSYPFLGIHGGYDILNGSKSYDLWVKKAKWMGVSTLGICEKNTLGGVLKFQLACEKGEINFVIGEEVTVKNKDKLHAVKLFVKDRGVGWKNLLLINKEINVTNLGKLIELSKLMDLTEGLVLVFDPKSIDFEYIFLYDLHLKKEVTCFYQLDTVVYDNQKRDKAYLDNLKKFIESDLKPVLINDAYYLDEAEYPTKQLLNSISGHHEPKSKNQYFKTLYENFKILSTLFKEEDIRLLNIFEKSLENLRIIESECSKFSIQTKVWHLPEYIQTEEEQVKYFDNNEHLFLDLIEVGLKERTPEGEVEPYMKRVEEEYPIIADNGFIDYFLILWDIIKWAKSQGILTGIARGSAGGSLIAYLLHITEIDPIEYGLLFSRFLNEGRAKNSIPDIDTDFQGSRREEVKKYMEQRYGAEQVCSVGTYTNLKLKAALKDISKLNNIPFGVVNHISQILDIENGAWSDIFRTANHKQQVKNFVYEYPGVIEDMKLILNQPKSRSIHACATIILPNTKSVFEWIPVRLDNKNGEGILVSEWEGGELESAGFLKEDILGILQLDKYAFILNLIKEQLNEDVDIYSLPLEVKGVYDLFSKGHNNDVFHFGAKGLMSYCKELKPQNMEDLIAGISLYRPGTIENNFHNEYILRKEGRSDIHYFKGGKEILETTYGVFVYQEQIMKLCQVLGGFSLVEADDVRRAMGKKKFEILHQYEGRFIQNYVKSFEVTKEYAENVWKSIEQASSYLFNRSHAAAYAIMAYISQWLKYNYPLQYWTSAFQFDNPDPKKSKIKQYISEIKHTDNFIKIMPPDINESGGTFLSNPDEMELYWSIDKVKQLGEKALEAIISEREKNGEFFSLEEFLGRVEKRVVNKAVVINLILSGSFDKIEKVTHAADRKRLINKYYEFMGTKRAKDDVYLKTQEDYWWQIKQKELSGFGDIDYPTIIKSNTKLKFVKYVSAIDLEDKQERTEAVVAGMISKVDVRTTKNGDDFCRLTVDSNNEELEIVIWSDIFTNIDRSELETGKIVALNGSVIQDNYKHKKVIHSNDKTKIYII